MSPRAAGMFVCGLAALGAALAGRAPAAPSSPRAAAYARFFEAQQAAGEGRFDDARTLYQEVLALDPRAADVQAMLARLCLRDGDVVCAEERAADAIAAAPGNAAAHRVLADIDLQRFEQRREPRALDEAVAHLSAAAEAAPQDAPTWLSWIRALSNGGRYDDAEAVARRAAATPGIDPVGPYLALARAYVSRGGTERAIALLEGVDVSGRNAAPVLETLVDLKAARGDVPGQIAALERLRQLRPDDADVAYRLGALRLAWGDLSGAEPPLRDAFNGREQDPQVRRDYARTLVRLGRGAEALELLRGLPPVQRAPHTVLLWAQAAEQAGKFSEAADRLEDLVAQLSAEERASFGAALRLRAGRDRLRAGQADRALALAAQGSVEDAEALRLRLDALDALGRGDEAARLLAERGAARPADASLVALAGLRGARDAPSARPGPAGVSAALAQLQKAPHRERAAAEAAVWLTAWQAAPLGAALLDAVGVPEPAEPELLRARASTLYAAGRIGEAEASYRRLVDLRPDDDGALNDLGYLLATENRELPEALRLLQRAVDLRPDQPAYLDSLGYALARAGRAGDALPVLLRASQNARENDDAAIREHLGDVYAALGDRVRARAEWSAALALGAEDAERVKRKLAELPAATPTTSAVPR